MEKVSQAIIKEVEGERSFLILVKRVEKEKEIITLQSLYIGHGRRQDPVEVYAKDLIAALKKLKVESVKALSEEEKKELLSKPVGVLNLSARSTICLRNAEIETLGQLVEKTTDDLLRVKNFGRKSLVEIKESLAELGLSLKDEQTS